LSSVTIIFFRAPSFFMLLARRAPSQKSYILPLFNNHNWHDNTIQQIAQSTILQILRQSMSMVIEEKYD